MPPPSSQWIGVHVFFWDANDTAIYGTVVGDETTRADGTHVLIIETKSGKCVNLPAAGVTVVPSPQ